MISITNLIVFNILHQVCQGSKIKQQNQNILNQTILQSLPSLTQVIQERTTLLPGGIEESIRLYVSFSKILTEEEWKAFNQILGSYETMRNIFEHDTHTCFQIMTDTAEALNQLFGITR